MGGGAVRGGVNLKRRNARRRFKISALCIGGQFSAAISISEAANDRYVELVWVAVSTRLTECIVAFRCSDYIGLHAVFTPAIIL